VIPTILWLVGIRNRAGIFKALRIPVPDVVVWQPVSAIAGILLAAPCMIVQ